MVDLLTAGVLVGAVVAVLFAVAEEATLDAGAVTAGERAVLAQGLVRVQQRLHLALLVLQLAVLDGVLPVARLLLDVEVQAGGTPDSLETLEHANKRERLISSKVRSFSREAVERL